MKHTLSLLSVSLLSILSADAFASMSVDIPVPSQTNYTEDTFVSEKSQWNPYVGRITGSAAITSTAIFNGDGMLPVYGNADHFLYTDFEGGGATNSTYLVSPGGGVRWVNNNHLLGTYLFGDYQQTEFTQHFWVVNPGIEFMTPRWEFHLNGYFPTEKQSQISGIGFADNFGQTGSVTFSGHNQYDNLVTPYAMIGNGVDTAVGYSLPFRHLRARALLGGYFYDTPSEVSNITGVTGTIELPLSRRTDLTVSDSYDNVNHNIASVGLSLTLGGESNLLTEDVHTRLLDPTDRHIGIIETGAGTYAQQGLVDTGSGQQLQYDNVWFFQPGTATQSNDTCGTYENPCVGLNQGEIDEAGANSRLYLASGDYFLSAGSSLTLNNNDQSFWGRTSNYQASATGTARPTLKEGFLLTGNQISLNDVMINPAQPTGLSANAIIDNSGTDNLLSDIDITSVASGGNAVVGIYNESTGVLTLDNSILTVSKTASGSYDDGIDNSGSMTINQSTISQSDYGSLISNNSGNLTINQSVLSVINENGSSNGILNYANLTLNNSSVFATNNQAIQNNSMLILNHSTIMVSGNGVTGVSNSSSATANINQSSITVNGDNAYGIYNDGNITFTGNSTISVNGSNSGISNPASTGTTNYNDTACSVDGQPAVCS